MASQNTIDKVNKLLSGHCWEPLKVAAGEWLQAVGSDAEQEAEKKLIPLLKGGVATVDEMLETFGADDAAEKFGDMAAEILQYAKGLQAAGKKYCECPVCTLVKEILADFGETLD